MVVNLAAGLDARPYRMNLPGSLQWVEVDLPEILAYKEDVLRNETPVCQVERVRLDLSDVRVRRELFSELGRQANRALVEIDLSSPQAKEAMRSVLILSEELLRSLWDS